MPASLNTCYPMLAAVLLSVMNAVSALSYAHTIEINPSNPSAGAAVVATMEGIAPTNSPYQVGYVERDGVTLKVYGTIGLGILPLFSSYRFHVDLGSFPVGEYEAVYFGRFQGDVEYQQWDSVQFGVSPPTPIPSLSVFSKTLLVLLFLTVAVCAFAPFRFRSA